MPDSDIPTVLKPFPIVVRIPVQWSEMDAYGHVNNTVLFRYFESARITYLERCGFLESYDTNRIGAILHSTECRFRQPLHHPDEVLVGARATSVNDDRFTHSYTVFSQESAQVAAVGSAIVVSFDYEKRATTPIPVSVRDGIARLERAAEGSAIDAR
ncbi:MAG: acyl-CoA thioesterase [Gemmatimonadota bacterium]|nr:MAG: acyl-CoA thioesterase [Gemmatimonadota bacterium]